MYQDLHSHTILSDGKTTYQESLDACFDNNISVVAFTDHDLVPEKDELNQLEKLRNHQTDCSILPFPKFPPIFSFNADFT